MSYEKHGDKYVFSEIERKRWWKFYFMKVNYFTKRR